MIAEIGFHEFLLFLNSCLSENFSEAEIIVLAGGDSVKDTVMGIKISGVLHRYVPYDMYLQGRENNSYEEVVGCFVNKCRE